MNGPLGLALIALGGVGAAALLVAWRRLELRVAVVAMAVAGAVVGAGALLIQDEVEPSEWIVALVGFGVVAPLHAHLVRSDRRP